MLQLIDRLMKSTKKYEVIFRMVSGKSEVYYSENGKLELRLSSSPDSIYFTDHQNTKIINLKNIESITFSPII